MLSSPPARGLIAGLLIGFVLGYWVAPALMAPAGGGSSEVEKLRHQLESERRERAGLERNLEDFGTIAERMTGAFEALEQRFRALEERLREASPAEIGSVPTAPSPAPTP
jgi:hypothetical protein